MNQPGPTPHGVKRTLGATRLRVGLQLGLFVATQLVVAGCGGERGPSATARPDATRVIFIIADSLRADRLSLYGHSRDTSPHLEILARDGVVFERAFSQAPWTPPSMASWMTGLYQSSHGVTHSMRSQGAHSRLDDRHLTLAELFRSVGYRTGAITAQPWISEKTGFAQGFDSFEVVTNLNDPYANDKVMVEGLNWIRRQGEQPFFLYLHTMDPHYPYEPPELFRFDGEPAPPPFEDGVSLQELEALNAPASPSKEQLAHLLDLYDAEVRYVDWWLGVLDRQLRADGLRDRTLIVFSSDHGEAFYEHGVWGHITTVYNEMLHIPLVLSQPGLEARRVAAPVESIDLLPTLARLAGFEAPAGLPGHDLLGDERPGLAYAEGDGLRQLKIQSRELSLLVEPQRRFLFDLLTDPLERHDVARQRPQDTERMLGLLRDRHRAAAALALDGEAATVTLEEQTREQLEALGYAR